MGCKSWCKDVFTPKLASVQSLPLSTMVDWTCWMANNWVPSIFSSRSHTASIAWAILARESSKSSFPLLVHCGWWPKRGMIPLCATNIPLCAPLMSKEALVVVLKRLQVRNHCPGVCFLWSQKVAFSTPRIACISGQKVHKDALHEGLCMQKHLWLAQIWFLLRLLRFLNAFQIL